MAARYIAIEGNIGAGKTTLARLLAGDSGAKLVLEEFADNTFLPKFYSDPARYAFPLELSFLADRYKQLKEYIATPNLFTEQVIADYLFVKSKLFARINLDAAEYELFTKVFDVMDLHLPQPDVLLYLHAPLDILQAHIRERGRPYEIGLSNDYLLRISNMYEEYLKTVDVPVIMIDTAAIDFRTNTETLNSLTTLLNSDLQRKRYFLSECAPEKPQNR